MVEALRDTGAEQRQRPPFFIRNVLVAHAIAFAASRMLDDGLIKPSSNIRPAAKAIACATKTFLMKNGGRCLCSAPVSLKASTIERIIAKRRNYLKKFVGDRGIETPTSRSQTAR